MDPLLQLSKDWNYTEHIAECIPLFLRTPLLLQSSKEPFDRIDSELSSVSKDWNDTCTPIIPKQSTMIPNELSNDRHANPDRDTPLPPSISIRVLSRKSLSIDCEKKKDQKSSIFDFSVN